MSTHHWHLLLRWQDTNQNTTQARQNRTKQSQLGQTTASAVTSKMSHSKAQTTYRCWQGAPSPTCIYLCALCKEIIFQPSVPVPHTPAFPAAEVHIRLQAHGEGAGTLAVRVVYY